MANAPQKKDPAEIFVLPEGRLINHSLFEMDAYKDPTTGKVADPSYKVEIAYNPADVMGEGKFEDKFLDAVEKAWPADLNDCLDFLEGKPARNRWSRIFIDGNKMAADRAAKGKEGDAYKGKLILRAHSVFNKTGQKGTGGMPVHGPNLESIGIVEGNTGEVFNGCYGHVAVTLGTSEINGNRYVTAYLKAFQKTRGTDADRLAKGADTSSLFKPVGGGAAAPAEGRRRRAG